MALTFKNISVGYKKAPLFENFSAQIESGQMLAVLGCNGVGKSTLLKTIANKIPPIKGDIELDNIKIENNDIGYLSQRLNINVDIPISLSEFVHTGLFAIKHKELAIAPEEALKIMDIYQFKDINIGKLSGGQLIRAAIARIIVQNPKIIILDEPFAFLDKATQILLSELLNKWKNEGKIIIVSIHDERLAKSFDHFLNIDGKNFYWEEKLSKHKEDCLLCANSNFETIS